MTTRRGLFAAAVLGTALLGWSWTRRTEPVTRAMLRTPMSERFLELPSSRAEVARALTEQPRPQTDNTATLLGLPEPRQLLRVDLGVLASRVRKLAGDPELLLRLRSVVDRWRADEDAEVRRCGEFVLVYLDGVWEDRAQFHSDSALRSRLLEHPPDGSDKTTEVLIRAIESDVDREIRRSALRGIPSEPGRGHLRRLVGRLRTEFDREVRIEAIGLLGTMRTDDPAAIDALKSSAFSSSADSAEVRAARRSLLKCSNEHPGILTDSEKETLDQVMRAGR